MTHGGKVLLCLAGGLLICVGAKALVADSSDQSTNATDNPYQAIIDRNVFGLKPPPPPPPPPETKKEASKLILAGITTMMGNKRAMLKTQTAAKPGQPASDQYYALAEGQRDGDIEVVEIDEKAGTVKVNNAGSVVTLDFENNGNKPPVSALPPPGTPGAPGAPGGIPAVTGAAPGGFAPAAPGLKPLPTRALRAPAATPSSSVQGQSDAGVASTGVNALGVTSQAAATVPTANVTSPSRSGALKPWPPEVNLSPAEEAIIIEAQREANKNNPNFPPLPPTVLSRDLTPPQTTQPGTTPLPIRTGPPRAPALPPLLPQ